MASPISEDTEVTSQHRSPHLHAAALDQVQAPAQGQGQYSAEKDFGHPLAHQNSIYSLTLDEIQNTVCEPGRNFGSMNMDEFLTNIWNAEEGQALGQATTSASASLAGAADVVVAPALQRQASLTVPPPLSRKTVEEVWTEIHHRASQGGPVTPPGAQPAVNGGMAAANGSRQPTFGEMTLEDFLIKAGVVREPTVSVRVAPPQFGQMPVYPMGVDMGAAGMYGAPMMGGPNMNLNMNGGMMHGMMVGPVGSPGTPDGMGDDVAGYDRVGRKRSAGAAGMGGEGMVVEKGVERRQRRMIKNRESAARSRARKQAYTVELEAELNQLKEENARLKEEEKKVLQLKRQMLLEAITEQAYVHAQQAKGSLRRSFTCTW